MKYLIVLLLMPPLGFGQSDELRQRPCGADSVWMWGMGTTGCFYPSGCYTKKESHENEMFIEKCACEETSTGFGSMRLDGATGKWINWGWDENHVWSDSLGCITTYFLYEKGKTRKVSRVEFDCAVYHRCPIDTAQIKK